MPDDINYDFVRYVETYVEAVAFNDFVRLVDGRL